MLSINNLNYKNLYNDFNLEIPKNNFITILGTNRSGKTILTKIISGIIPTTDTCILDNISLNKNTVLTYLTKLGVVSNDFNQEFLFKKVKEELAYPLLNLGYPEAKLNKRIKDISKYFEIEDLLNKNIEDLSISKRKLLLIIISIIHEPRLVVLDDAFLEMNKSDKYFMINKLNNLKKKGLTILNLTSDIETTITSDKIYILDNFNLEDYKEDSRFKESFIIQLSNKLKELEVTSQTYFNMEDLVGALWK